MARKQLRLFKHQLDFVQSPATKSCFVGGVAAGKTKSAMDKMMLHLIKYKTEAIMCRISTIETKRALLPDLLKGWPELIDNVNKMDGIITLKNGSLIHLIGAWDDVRGIAHLDGYNISCFYISQGEMVPEASYRALQRRNRREGVPEHIEIIECNPPSADHWIAREFYTGATMTEKSIEFGGTTFTWKQFDKPGSFALQMPSQRFPFLPPGFIDEIMKDTSARNREKYINGEFGRNTGLVYPCFNKHDNVIEPFVVRESISKSRYVRIYGLDIGYNNPTAGIHYIYDKQNDCFYLVSEYYENEKTNRTNAELMKPILERYDFDVIVVDPAVNQTNKSTGQTDIQDYIDVWGDDLAAKIMDGVNAVESGIDKVYDYIERGKVLVFPTMSNFLYEIENYRYKNTVNLNNKTVPVKKDDHCMDNLKLVIASKDLWLDAPMQEVEAAGGYAAYYRKLNDK